MDSTSEGLRGARVALLESRMGSKMGELVRRYGGNPLVVPAVREILLDAAAPVGEFLTRLQTPASRTIIFLTGAGATALFQEADRRGQLSILLESLRRSTLACRGPKPVAALKRQGLSTSLAVASPYTSVELLDALRAIDLDGHDMTLVHYGERNDALAAQLRARGARLYELCLYEWQLPEDTQPIKSLVEDIVAGNLDAVVFTSQIQARHLLRMATEMQLDAALIDALNAKTVVAAVGPICQTALEESGIIPHVVPCNPKMGPLIAALAEYFLKKR